MKVPLPGMHLTLRASRHREAAVDVACWCAVQADGNEPYFRAWLNVFKLLKVEQQQAALPDDNDT
ncbi:hypothetical protein ASC75_23885 [Aminobacter sp. DSM 101952]|nr:hypothetical protein ASC75_23885 [Aminobacter sp. DSM 101952]